MARWIVVAVAVLGVALALRVAAGVAQVDLNPVTFVQSLGDENEPDENEGGGDSQQGGEGDEGD
jgi:hypothetical protein